VSRTSARLHGDRAMIVLAPPSRSGIMLDRAFFLTSVCCGGLRFSQLRLAAPDSLATWSAALGVRTESCQRSCCRERLE
jgi:hypothetical protein